MIKELDFKDFLDNNLKENFLKIKKMKISIAEVALNLTDIYELWKKLMEDNGLFEGDFFREYVEEKIYRKLKIQYATFSDLDRKIKEGHKFKHIYLTGTNVTTGEIEIFSHLHTPNVIISDAVRITMSIPVIFRPHSYYIKFVFIFNCFLLLTHLTVFM